MRIIALPVWLAVTLLVPLAGCSCLPCLDQPYRPSGCSGSWDPVLGSCDACGVCGGDCAGHTPSSYLKHQLTCGSGCGEIYWGEWLSDPPNRCDPCDDCGNWIGQRVCDPTCWERFVGGWCSFWGFRADGCSSCSPAPCTACGTSCGGGCSPGKGTPSSLDFGPLVVPPPIDVKPGAMAPMESEPSSGSAPAGPAAVEPSARSRSAPRRSVLRSTRLAR